MEIRTMSDSHDLNLPDSPPSESWVTTVALVSAVDNDPEIGSAKQTGTLTDGEQSVDFISWEASNQPRVESGTAYRFEDLFMNDSGDYIFRSDTTFEPVSAALSPVEYLLTSSRAHKNSDYVNKMYVTPIFTNIFNPFETCRGIDAPVRERGVRARRSDCNIQLHPDGFKMDFRTVYRDDLHSGAATRGTTDAHRHEQKQYRNETEFLNTFQEIPEVTVEVAGDFEMNELEVCANCNETIAKAADSCYDCETEETQSATIHEEITVSGIVSGEHTVTGFREFSKVFGGKLMFSPEKAIDLIGADVVRESALQGHVAAQHYRSDNYNVPSTAYHSLHIGFEQGSVTEETAGRFKDQLEVAFSRLSKFGIGVSDSKLVSEDDSSFAVFVTGSMATETTRYPRFSEVEQEAEEKEYPVPAKIVVPDTGLWRRAMTEYNREVVDVSLNLSDSHEEIPLTREYHIDRQYPALFN
jgi:hypothetical protein